MCLLASSHPDIFISWGSCMLACILASSHPHILRSLCIWLYPHVMSYSQVCVCLLVSWHPHILISLVSYVLVAILASSYRQIHVCFLLSLHPHILRFMCVSFYPCILSSRFYLYIILIYISQTNIYINTLKKVSCNLQYNKRIKPTGYWTQHWKKS